MAYGGPTATYDEQYLLSITASSVPDGHPGPLLANGKVATVPSQKRIGTDSTFITVAPQFTGGVYQNNVLQTFNVHDVQFFDREDPTITITGHTNALHMDEAVYQSEFDIAQGASNQVNVTCEMFAPRTLPFCTVQKLQITPLTADMSHIDLFLEVSAPGTLDNVAFNNNTLHNTHAQTAAVHVLAVSASHKAASQVCGLSALVYDDSLGYRVDNLGFNVSRSDARRAFNKFRITNTSGATFSVVQTIVVTFLGVHMTSFDFDLPVEETRRLCLSVLSKELSIGSAHPMQDYMTSLTTVRTLHVARWTELWKSSFNIYAKAEATNDDKAKVVSVRRAARVAFYNLFSCVRENLNVSVNHDAVPVIDLNGQFLYELDIWLVPLLLLLLPSVAKAMIEYRYHTAGTAAQLAASYGFAGFKYPASTDVLGYKNSLYWDPYASLTMFNSAYVAINAWNYYRTTQDKDWLSRTGFPIIRGVADFLCTLVVEESGELKIKNVVGLGLRESTENNAFSVNLVRLTLKYAIEASYELNTPVSTSWFTYMDGLTVPTYTSSLTDVVKYDGAANSPETLELNILEPLALLIPQYSSEFFLAEYSRLSDTLERNLVFYGDKASEAYANHPYNMGLLAMMQARVMQTNTYYLSLFDNALLAYVSAMAWGAWHNFKVFGTDEAPYFDLTSGAIFLYVVLHGVAGLRVQGGVSESQFYYEELKVTNDMVANMPAHWREIQVIKTGNNVAVTTRIMNNVV